MVTRHKINTDFYDDTFSLVAIHSSLEDHSMVFMLNNFLKTGFKRKRKDLILTEAISFPIYDWEDSTHDRYWTCMVNSCEIEESYNANDLFGSEVGISKHHLIPEYKEADFFLKIEQDGTFYEEEVIRQVSSIPQVITAYSINSKELNSIENIIY
ncbi:MAG: IPExxxVDY family protein [Eudoraea sp.]|nr:IPExxxVDY family protein [Eudoraea sp.]